MNKAHFYHGSLNRPVVDDVELVAIFGSKAYSDDVAPPQYAAWAEQIGLMSFLADKGSSSIAGIVDGTDLTENGADALIGVLASMALVLRRTDRVSLSLLASEYLVPGKQFYMGDSFYLTCKKPLPAFLVKKDKRTGKPVKLASGAKVKREPRNLLVRKISQALKRLRGWDWGGHKIFINQHSRNLPVSVAASRLDLFKDALCVVDMAGGSGTFAIPLAQLYPDLRIILTDLPQALPEAQQYLEDYKVQNQVELIGMDVFSEIWPVPVCDVIFFGNLAHGFDHDKCLHLAKMSKGKLQTGGKVVFHELVWNGNKDGPLKTALWNVTMREFGGQQRTVSELQEFLQKAGFEQLFAIPTSGGFVAVGGCKPD
ncbi:MAG: hypothetical protein ACI9CB_000956 [Rhodothermales bacterium]|jgi:hypothetical protein